MTRGCSSVGRERVAELRDVVRLISVPFNRCTRDPSVCERSASCPFCEIFTEAQQQLVEKLGSTTLKQLADRLTELEATAA